VTRTDALKLLLIAVLLAIVLTLLVAILGIAPLAAEAQPAGKVYRIGSLEFRVPDPAHQALWDAFRQRMRELGYAEGQNVTFEPRWSRG